VSYEEKTPGVAVVPCDDRGQLPAPVVRAEKTGADVAEKHGRQLKNSLSPFASATSAASRCFSSYAGQLDARVFFTVSGG
jgi:hypothetical protein